LIAPYSIIIGIHLLQSKIFQFGAKKFFYDSLNK